MKKAFFTALLFATLAAAPAFAKPAVDAAGADALKKHVEESLAVYGARDNQGLVLGGAAEVTPRDGFYEIRLPQVKIMADGASVDIGTVTVNAKPAGDDAYTLTAALPQKLTVKDGAGKDTASLSFGAQKFTGLWHPALGSLTQMNVSYDTVVLKSLQDPPVLMDIGSFTSKMALKKDGDKWSGPITGLAKNVNIGLAAEDGSAFEFKIDTLRMETLHDKIDLAGMWATRKKLQKFFKDNATPDAAKVAALMKDISKESSEHAEGITNRFSVSGVTMKTTSPAAPERSATLDKLDVSMGVTGLTSDKGDAALDMNFSGFKVSDAPAGLAGIVPHTGKILINAGKLPLKNMSSMVSDLAGTLVSLSAVPQTDDKQVEAAVDGTVLGIPVLLAKSGAAVEMKDSYLKSADTTILLQGRFTAQDTKEGTLPPAAGNLVVAVEGFDEFIAKLQGMAANDPAVVPYMQALGILQLIGQPDKTAAGKSLRKYTLEQTPDGRTLMNGADVSGLPAMMGGAMPQDPAKPAPAKAPAVEKTP